jgi:spermidine synthase
VLNNIDIQYWSGGPKLFAVPKYEKTFNQLHDNGWEEADESFDYTDEAKAKRYVAKMVKKGYDVVEVDGIDCKQALFRIEIFDKVFNSYRLGPSLIAAFGNRSKIFGNGIEFFFTRRKQHKSCKYDTDIF